ncbi:MAG: winged helix DNA-binding domain-containing protein [Pseudonocardia sp.]
MQLTRRDLNRTLLARQHLLERTSMPVAGMVAHLVGLQAQETLPPYLSLAARVESFDPYDVSRGLQDRSLVRLLTMRGTIHLLVPGDALTLRGFTHPAHERERTVSQNTRPGIHLPPEEIRAAAEAALADGPLPVKALGEAMAEHFPGVPSNALAHLARVDVPLVQLPPRGCWQQSGGVVYDRVDNWLGRRLTAPDPEAIVRRYLAAFGPATAADVTAWSGVTRLGPVVSGMDDLVRHQGPDGRPVYDVPDGEIVGGDVPAPPRLLGAYDNVWLSHAGRDRVTAPEKRTGWMGPNGGVASTVFFDGMLEGLWRLEDGRIRIQLFREPTRRESAGLDDEITRVEELLARKE